MHALQLSGITNTLSNETTTNPVSHTDVNCDDRSIMIDADSGQFVMIDADSGQFVWSS